MFRPKPFFLIGAIIVLTGCGGSSPEEEAAKAIGKGDSFFKSGFYKEALTQYQQALDSRPNDAELHLAIAKCQENLGLVKESLASYDAAIRHDPELTEAYRGKAFLLLKRGRIQDTKDFVKQLESNPELEPLVFYLQGEIASANGDWKKAADSFQAALERDREFQPAAEGLAQVYLNTGKDEKAVEIYAEQLEREPDDLRLSFELAEIHRLKGRPLKAVEVLSNLLEKHAQNAAVHGRLARAYLTLEKYDDADREGKDALGLDPNEPVALYVSGRLALRRGDSEHALKDLENALRSLPDDDEVKQAYREAQVAGGLIVDKVRVAKEKIRSQGETPEALVRLAEAYIEQGEPELALPEAEKALAGSADNLEAQIVEAEALFLSNHLADASRALERLGSSQDGRILAMRGLVARDTSLLQKGVERLKSSSETAMWGDYYEAMGHSLNRSYAQAVKILDGLMEKHSDFGLPVYDLARFYSRIYEPVLAEVLYRRLMEKFPDSSKPALLLANLLSGTGKTDRAELLANDLLAKNPSSKEALFLSGRIRLQTHQFAQAAETFSRLVATATEDPGEEVFFRSFLAKTFVFDRQYDRAATQYDLILKKQPTNSGAFIEKALAEMAGGRNEDALQTCETGIGAATEAHVLKAVKAVVLQQLGQPVEGLQVFESASAQLVPGTKGSRIIDCLHAGLLLSASEFLQAKQVIGDSGNDPLLVKFYETTIDRCMAEGCDLKRLNVGLLFTLYKWPDAALAVYQGLSGQNPRDPTLLAYLGEAQKEAGLNEEAYETFSKGVAAEPGSIYFLRARATLAATLRRYEEANRDYLSCLAKDPKNPDPALQFDLARVYESQGLIEDAIATYRAVLQLNPPPGLMMAVSNNLAWQLSKDPETLDEALQNALKALEIQSDGGKPDGNVLDTVGWIYFLKGNLEEAQKYVGQALERLPTQPTISYHMGRIFEAMDQPKAAFHNYVKALNTNPNFPEADDARPRIPILKEQIGG